MTQQADPRSPAIDSSVDAETTVPGTPADGPAPARPAGWPPTTPAGYAAPAGYATPPSPPVGVGPMPPSPAPQAPLNTLSWLSVVMAFVVSPVAIVLGLVARKQIARTGERGRGLATLGTVLGAVFSLVGIASTIVVLVLAGQVSATVSAATAPAPAVTAGTPAAIPAPARAPGSAPAGTTSDDATAGQAQLMAGFIRVGSAAETMSSDLDEHSGDLNAMQGDFAAYRDAISQFRTTATTVTLAPDVRAEVDADLVPAIDRVLADLDTLSTSSSQGKLSAAADRLQGDSQAMVTAATTAVGG